MSKFSELIWDKEGFEVKLHCEKRFDDEAYTQTDTRFDGQ